MSSAAMVDGRDKDFISCSKRRDIDVEEIDLNNGDLSGVEELGRFRNLHRLILNNNRLLHLDFLSHNFRLAELFLHDNKLTSITGRICHLRSLKLLYLHNNQLQHLDQVVYEFRHMTGLKHLTLHGNPISKLPNYRATVIFATPMLERFDSTDIEITDKREAMNQCNRKMAALQETIAFGTRIENGRVNSGDVSQKPKIGHANRSRDNRRGRRDDAALTSQGRSRTVMTYTCFDWSKTADDQSMSTSSVKAVASRSRDAPSQLTVRLI